MRKVLVNSKYYAFYSFKYYNITMPFNISIYLFRKMKIIGAQIQIVALSFDRSCHIPTFVKSTDDFKVGKVMVNINKREGTKQLLQFRKDTFSVYTYFLVLKSVKVFTANNYSQPFTSIVIIQ